MELGERIAVSLCGPRAIHTGVTLERIPFYHVKISAV